MKKRLKILTEFIVVPTVLGLTLAGCSGIFGGNSETQVQQVTETEGANSDVQTETADPSGEETFTYTGNIPEGFTERDFITQYSDYITVKLSDGSSSTDGEGVSIDGDTITFTKAGTYLLKGSLSRGQIVVDLPGESDKIQLVLDGVDITNTGSAGLYVKNADKVFVTTTKGSENSIESNGEFVQSDDVNVDGAIFSKDDIVFNGEGSLSVQSETGHGIVSKNDLKITSGTYSVESEGKALQGKDFAGIAGGDITLEAGTDGIDSVRVAVYEGSLNIKAGDDGIKSEENDENTSPEVTLAGGSLDIESGDDAIQTTGDLTMESADIKIVAGGGSANAAEHFDDMAFGNMGGWGGMGQHGPEFGADPSSNGEINYDTDDDENINDGSKNKGIKAANIYLKDGNLSIDAQDDAVNADGAVVITAGKYSLTAGDDGIHADNNITINGGTLVIEAWEGLESTKVTINDGEINITAKDDGVNVAQKVNTESPALEINGGNISVDMAQGDTDALDSNGTLYINGGTIELNCQSPFDYDGDGAINGGTVYVNGDHVTEIYNQFFGGGPGMR